MGRVSFIKIIIYVRSKMCLEVNSIRYTSTRAFDSFYSRQKHKSLIPNEETKFQHRSLRTQNLSISKRLHTIPH